MKCKLHPKYKGVTKPNRDCQKCWKIFEKKNPDGDTYKNWMNKCKTHKKYTAKKKPSNECKGCWDYYNWKNDKHESLNQLKYNKKKRSEKKLKQQNKKTYKNISKKLQKEFIKKDAYYYDWKDNYNLVDNPYQYIISTAVVNYVFYKNITKYMLFKFFETMYIIDDSIFVDIWLEVLKQKINKEDYESIEQTFNSEPKRFSSYALNEYKEFIETKYFNKKTFEFKDYKLEIKKWEKI